jgi:hypothetical protein
MALGGAARADIINGGFSQVPDWHDGLDWEALILPEGAPDPNVVGGRLHVEIANTYNWDSVSGQWVLHESDPSVVVVTQIVPPDGGGFWAPQGTDAIEFDAEISILNNPSDNTGSGVRFEVNYNGSYASTGEQLLGNTNGKVRVEMPGLVPDGQVGIDLSLTTLSMLDVSPDPGSGTSYTITVRAYFDNFQFVPEPMSAGLLLVGAIMILLRRRRRRA